MTTDPAGDNQGATCDALSVGFGFTADPVVLGGVVTGTPNSSPCGADAATDNCATP